MLTMKVLGILPVVAIAIGLRPDARPSAGHPVTLHLTSFTAQPVSVHVSATPGGVQVAGDTTQSFVESRTIRTPADIRVSAATDTLRLTTDGNLAVRVQFTDGATPSERALAPWGRRLMFVRVNGDFRPTAELMPAQPTRTVFTDSTAESSR